MNAKDAWQIHWPSGAPARRVEVHPAPEKAISDGAQSLDTAQFQKMMKDLVPYIQLWNESRKMETGAAATH
jgi:3-deoxy-D-arabino-heptulosonate 7-phosphate (DAHP) synthase